MEKVVENGVITPCRMRVRLTFLTPILGSGNANPKIHEDFIASKSANKDKIAEEVEAIEDSVEDSIEKNRTVFSRMEDGTPCLWDYQIRGFFKHACGVMKKVPGSASASVKAHKKTVDDAVLIEERKIPIKFEGEITSNQRPLRASTPLGERVCLADSEQLPESSTAEFTILYLYPDLKDKIKEWLNYGYFQGIGQWRGSGRFGSFTWEEIN